MVPHPALDAYRRDAARQERLRAAREAVIAAWRDSDAGAPLAAALAGAAGLEGAAARERLRPLFDRTDWVDGLLARLLGLLAADPLTQLPGRTLRAGRLDGLAIHDDARLTLSLALVHPGPPDDSVEYGDGQIALALLRPAPATIERYRLGVDGPVRVASQPLSCGATHWFAHHEETPRIIVSDRPVVLLRLFLRAVPARPSLRYALPGGALLARANGDADATSRQMMLSLLGALGRAAPVAAATHDGDPETRWHAMRTWLATDPLAARDRLGAMAAADPAAEVRKAAAIAARVVDAAMERVPCPA